MKRLKRHLLPPAAVFCAGMVTACGHDAPAGADAGLALDAGASVDAGQADAGPDDAGLIDAGQGRVDAGQPDAGQADAGPMDAGQQDAGPADAGQVDAGQVDAGAPADVSDAFELRPAAGGHVALDWDMDGLAQLGLNPSSLTLQITIDGAGQSDVVINADALADGTWSGGPYAHGAVVALTVDLGGVMAAPVGPLSVVADAVAPAAPTHLLILNEVYLDASQSTTRARLPGGIPRGEEVLFAFRKPGAWDAAAPQGADGEVARLWIEVKARADEAAAFVPSDAPGFDGTLFDPTDALTHFIHTADTESSVRNQNYEEERVLYEGLSIDAPATLAQTRRMPGAWRGPTGRRVLMRLAGFNTAHTHMAPQYELRLVVEDAAGNRAYGEVDTNSAWGALPERREPSDGWISFDHAPSPFVPVPLDDLRASGRGMWISFGDFYPSTYVESQTGMPWIDALNAGAVPQRLEFEFDAVDPGTTNPVPGPASWAHYTHKHMVNGTVSRILATGGLRMVGGFDARVEYLWTIRGEANTGQQGADYRAFWPCVRSAPITMSFQWDRDAPEPVENLAVTVDRATRTFAVSWQNPAISDVRTVDIAWEVLRDQSGQNTDLLAGDSGHLAVDYGPFRPDMSARYPAGETAYTESGTNRPISLVAMDYAENGAYAHAPKTPAVSMAETVVEDGQAALLTSDVSGFSWGYAAGSAVDVVMPSRVAGAALGGGLDVRFTVTVTDFSGKQSEPVTFDRTVF